MTESMRQEAAYPQELAGVLADLDYTPPGRTWRLRLEDVDRGQGCRGLTLVINITGPDTYHRDKTVSVNHYMPVPAAAYSRQSWQAWLLEQVALVEQHERCEFFTVAGKRPYAPVHAPGWNPYLVTELATDEERRTSFRGEVNPE